MTGQEIINAALQQLGALDPGESPSSSDSTQALGFLNRMLDGWGTERLYVYTVSLVTQALSTGTASYALGARPVKIEAADVIYQTPGSEVRRAPLKMVSASQWAQIPNKGMQSATMQDGVLYCDYGFTTATVYLAPIPTFSAGTRTLELYTWQQLTQFASLVTDNNYPPGYLRAIVAALAYELMPSFAVPQTQAAAITRARDEAVAAIRALNGQLASDPNGAPPAGPSAANQQQ